MENQNTDQSFQNTDNQTPTFSNWKTCINYLLNHKNAWETRLQSLKKLDDALLKNRQQFNIFKTEMFKQILSEEASLLSTFPNPISIILNDILRIYVETMSKSYHSQTQQLFRQILKEIKSQFCSSFDEKIKELAIHHWQSINPSHLKFYIELFEIQALVNPNELLPKIDALLDDGKTFEVGVQYILALDLQYEFNMKKLLETLIRKQNVVLILNVIENNSHYQKEVIRLCLLNREATLAGEIVTKLKADPHQFPELISTLKRMAIRFRIREATWMQVEEFLCEAKDTLGILVEELVKAKKLNQALSIVKRWNLLEKQHFIADKRIRNQILSYFSKDPKLVFEYLENELFNKDDFAPTEEILGLSQPGTFWHLKDFGYDIATDLLFIDNCESEAFDNAISDILNAKEIGLDTEFKNLTRFDNSGTALLQIATEKKLYLIDSMKLSKEKKYNDFMKSLLSNPDIKKIGHTLDNDIDEFKVACNIKDNLVNL